MRPAYSYMQGAIACIISLLLLCSKLHGVGMVSQQNTNISFFISLNPQKFLLLYPVHKQLVSA
jgi:hypothetical protein